jgi:hypothetical protein
MNPDGKKIHCIPDPDKVNSGFQGIVSQIQQQQMPQQMTQQQFEEMHRLHPNPMEHAFDAASVMSSLARNNPGSHYMSHEQALHAVQVLTRAHQQATYEMEQRNLQNQE